MQMIYACAKQFSQLLRQMRAVHWLADVAIAAFVFFLGAALAYRITTLAEVLFFYQNQTPEIIYAACGFGYLHPGELSGPVVDFVMLRTVVFDCADLEGVETLQPPTLFATLQMYLGRTIAFFWRGPILSYSELWPLVALAYGTYAAGVYTLTRLFFPVVGAALGTGVLVFSPIALSVLTSFRDFSKAPFVIWALVFFILMVRSKGIWQGIGWSVGAGVVVGVGAGFRIDLIVLAALMVVSMFAIWGFKAISERFLRAAVFVLTVGVVAQPVFNIPDTGGNGTIVSQGLSEPFRRFLGLEGGSYILGHAYLDELAMSSVAAVERELKPDWDQTESKDFYDVSQVLKLSFPHIMRWVPYFTADLALQGLKSAAWVISMPSLVATERNAWDPGGPIRYRPDPSQWLGNFYDFVGQPWLVVLTLTGIVLFVWREAAIRPASAFSTCVLMAGLLAMPAAQFSVRHIFHLEFFWVFAVLALYASWFDRRRLKRVASWFLPSLAAVVVLVATVYSATVVYQDIKLARAFSDLLSLPREHVGAAERVADDQGHQTGRISVPVPASHVDIVSADYDALTDKLPIRGLAWDVRAEADRLLLTLDGCSRGEYSLVAEYEKRPGVWQPLDYSFSVKVHGNGPTQILLPAFYRPTQNFARLDVKPFRAECEASLERLVGDTPLPPHLIAWFPDNWLEIWQRRGFGTFGEAPK